ncbi:methyl-accepting chemotaxis protein [Sporosarcina pasteurii]|uniref:Methyl-accepting chemotaxis protein 4 n=1 Tax=Sporosarcina pasteurii TaxID=1474 RepID=A0A380BU91_SPOPA|nr:methyl-accepting chemotaxis protein [Sporosarcina pasteurii]MDS9471281.1 methyl-accepting chemotaxis protein [Sporosarcina pasteurii]SUJ06771.1 Methyl-accepting chemotaxis protein 4 [Sporosarcina pasteurii]
MKNTLTFQLGAIIVGIMIAMLAISSFATYKTAYDKLYDAAGVEAYGCANITTGLIEPGDIVKIKNGDTNTMETVGKQLNWTTAHKDIFETQYIIDLDGNLLAMDDHLAAKGLKVGDAIPIDDEAISTLLETKHPTYSQPYEFAGIERLSGYAPIFENHDSSGDVIAISVIDFDNAIVAERTWDVVRNGVLISLIPMVIAASITIYLIRRKTSQISSLINHAREIADGNLAIEDTVVNSRDEVGDLARTLNMMTANLRNIIGTMKTTAVQLTKNSSETAMSLNEMHDAIQQVAANMSDVTISISNGTANAEHASSILGTLADNIQASKVTADRSVENSKATMQVAENGQQRANEINEDMEKIRTESVDSGNTIQNLIESTTKIQDITSTIAGIAAQTNLLALNASIEAARAGEHGQGFAVVAEEVRKLAEQSNSEVLEVEKLVADITAHIQQVVSSTEESTALIESGTNTVRLTAESLSQVAQAVSKTVEEISSLSASTTIEAESSEQVVQLISELTREIHTIEDMSMNISAATERNDSID